MKEFTKQLLTGVIALGMLAPIATSSLNPIKTTINAKRHHKHYRIHKSFRKSKSVWKLASYLNKHVNMSLKNNGDIINHLPYRHNKMFKRGMTQGSINPTIVNLKFMRNNKYRIGMIVGQATLYETSAKEFYHTIIEFKNAVNYGRRTNHRTVYIHNFEGYEYGVGPSILAKHMVRFK